MRYNLRGSFDKSLSTVQTKSKQGKSQIQNFFKPLMKCFNKCYNPAQKMKFFTDFFSKCVQNPQFSTDLVAFMEETLNGKLHFLCRVNQ